MGIEAIHFGQVEIMDDWDRSHRHWRGMMKRFEITQRKMLDVIWSLLMLMCPVAGLCTKEN